jgi:hypothetical protein
MSDGICVHLCASVVPILAYRPALQVDPETNESAEFQMRLPWMGSGVGLWPRLVWFWGWVKRNFLCRRGALAERPAGLDTDETIKPDTELREVCPEFLGVRILADPGVIGVSLLDSRSTLEG